MVTGWGRCGYVHTCLHTCVRVCARVCIHVSLCSGFFSGQFLQRLVKGASSRSAVRVSLTVGMGGLDNVLACLCYVWVYLFVWNCV